MHLILLSLDTTTESPLYTSKVVMVGAALQRRNAHTSFIKVCLKLATK